MSSEAPSARLGTTVTDDAQAMRLAVDQARHAAVTMTAPTNDQISSHCTRWQFRFSSALS